MINWPRRRFVVLAAIGSAFLSGCVIPAGSTSPAGSSDTPCASGTPLAGDLDGDGRPDLLLHLGLDLEEDQPAAPGAWVPEVTDGALHLNDGLLATFADLNGDVCADLVTVASDYWNKSDDTAEDPARLDVTSYLGSTAGPSDPVVASGPEVDNGSAEDNRYRIQGIAVSLRGGQQQVMLAGLTQYEGSNSEQETLQVITLSGHRQAEPKQTIELRDHGLKSSAASQEVQLSLVAEADLVAVGHTGEIVAGKVNAGAVYLFTPQPGDPTQLEFRERILQGANGVPDSPRTNDLFGYSLALLEGRLAISAPGEKVGKARSAGLVQTMEWRNGTLTPGRAIRQGVDDAPGQSEDWDNYGEVLTMGRGLSAPDSYDIVIGTPMENDEERSNTGAVTIANFSELKYRRFKAYDTGNVLLDTPRAYFASGLSTIPDPATGQSRLLIISNGAQTRACKGYQGNVIASGAGLISLATTWEEMQSPCEVGHVVTEEDPTRGAETDLGFGWVPRQDDTILRSN